MYDSSQAVPFQDAQKPVYLKNRPPWITYIIIAILSLIIGAGVAGGIAGSLAPRSCQKDLHELKDSKSTFNATIPQSYCLTSSGSTNSSTNGTIYTAQNNYFFLRSCRSNQFGLDIVAITISSWDLCMESCANFNNYKGQSPNAGETCMGVVFVPSWFNTEYAISNISFTGNCFLKYNMTAVFTNDKYYETVSSRLIQ